MDRWDTEDHPMERQELNQNQHDNNNNLNAEEKSRIRRKCKWTDQKSLKNMVKSGNTFIVTFKKLLQNTKACKEKARHYMERVLHSIFFFGHINNPPISPDKFLPERLTEGFRNQFPKPFSEYNTHLPSYTPYSILLEYIIEHLKPEDPYVLIKQLETLNESLGKIYDGDGHKPIVNKFVATVVSYCCVKDSNNAEVLKKAYGASMSCKGNIQREIMIALSALHVWDKAISYAVSCEGNGPPITFPEQVQCSAYQYKPIRGSYKKIPPCTKCNKMYDVEYDPEHQVHDYEEGWPYGNCAENESINRLMQMRKDIRNNICIVGKNGEKLMNREEIENMFIKEYEDEKKNTVRKLLEDNNFMLNSDELKFFIPSCSL